MKAILLIIVLFLFGLPFASAYMTPEGSHRADVYDWSQCFYTYRNQCVINQCPYTDKRDCQMRCESLAEGKCLSEQGAYPLPEHLLPQWDK